MEITTNLPLAELQAPKDLAHAESMTTFWNDVPLSVSVARTTARATPPTTKTKPPASQRLKGAPMCNNHPTTITTPTAPEAERPALVKKIGKTTYRVKVHFSTTNTETMSDKIRRMLKNEVKGLSK